MAVRRRPRAARPALIRALAVALLGAAAFTASRALDDDRAAATTATRADHAATPILSARRLPGPFLDAAAARDLQASLDSFVDSNACVAVGHGDRDHDGDGLLARVRVEVPLMPASTLKLLTGAAALATFGPDHTFVTRVLRGGDSTVWIVGGADPTLTTAEYEARLRANPRTQDDAITPLAGIVDAITGAGLDRIDRLVADDSRHEDVRFLPVWRPNYEDDVGALAALTVDDGFAGETRVADPALLAAEQIGALLEARGVPVGAIERGVAPRDTPVLAELASPPLHDIVASMLRSSDNLTAELLTREIGLARTGAATTEAGTREIVAVLTELGLPMANVTLADGSGLARDNAATCGAVLAAVDLARRPGFEALDRGLPVAGRPGTLATRVAPDDPLAGVLRAKTGNLNDVAGLAGVVDDAEQLRFAFITNADLTTAAGQARATDAARLVAAYPQVPDPATLVPLP